MAHQNLVSCAADTGQVYPFGSFGFGQLYHLRVLSGGDNHLGEQRLVTMNYDVDLVFFQYTEVHLAKQGRRGAKENILKFGSNHAAAPAVS